MPSRPRILLVDYQPQNLVRVRKLLEESGLDVRVANDGISALEVFQQIRPDLVLILEAMIPRKHGFEVCKEIKRTSQGKVPVIVASTVYKGSRYRREAMHDNGCDEYIERPCPDEQFLSAVLRLLARAGSSGLSTPLPEVGGKDATASAAAGPPESFPEGQDIDRRLDEILSFHGGATPPPGAPPPAGEPPPVETTPHPGTNPAAGAPPTPEVSYEVSQGEFSPSMVPVDEGAGGEPAQSPMGELAEEACDLPSYGTTSETWAESAPPAASGPVTTADSDVMGLVDETPAFGPQLDLEDPGPSKKWRRRQRLILFGSASFVALLLVLLSLLLINASASDQPADPGVRPSGAPAHHSSSGPSDTRHR
ncbi:MAG: hypothetical protein DMF49_02825 [Acidobacteria bacterium]|nr:MAG: hypothetical protein DMF49_02825 [Acidobacteriota bacterium]